MDIITVYGTAFVIMAMVFGLYMCWGIGANDVANAMGTSVGSGAITVMQAIIIAAVFEFAGAFLAGGHVTATIRKGIIDPTPIMNNPELLVYGMLAALLAAGIWLMIASSKGWPVSTTHSIVGAIVGFTMAGIGVDAVQWGKITQIVASWVVSPLLGGTIAFPVDDEHQAPDPQYRQSFCQRQEMGAGLRVSGRVHHFSRHHVQGI